MTQANYNNMKKHKGIGVNEVGTTFSFCAPYGDGKNEQQWGWFRTLQQAMSGTQEYGKTWDNDLVLIGNSDYTFVVRGGDCFSGSNVGVLYSHVTNGFNYHTYGFRAVLVGVST